MKTKNMIISEEEWILILWLSSAFSILLGANPLVFLLLFVWNTAMFYIENKLPAIEYWIWRKTHGC